MPTPSKAFAPPAIRQTEQDCRLYPRERDLYQTTIRSARFAAMFRTGYILITRTDQRSETARPNYFFWGWEALTYLPETSTFSVSRGQKMSDFDLTLQDKSPARLLEASERAPKIEPDVWRREETHKIYLLQRLSYFNLGIGGSDGRTVDVAK